jgi:hypothetical protein
MLSPNIFGIISVLKLAIMKITNLFLIVIVSFLLKIHVYVLTFVECVSRAGIHSIEDFFGLFTANGNMLNFLIGVFVNLAILYFTIKLKTVILKKILNSTIVLKIATLFRNIALFFYNRYYSKAV